MSPHRVVLIGHGMAGHRFCEETRRRDPDGSAIRLSGSNHRPPRAASPAPRPTWYANEFSWAITFLVPRLSPHLAVWPLLLTRF